LVFLNFSTVDFLRPPLLDDFAGYRRFAGIGAQQDLLVVRMDGQDGAKVHLFPTLPSTLSMRMVSPGATRYCFPRFE